MAQASVRNLEAEVKARLKRCATQHGWSMDEKARQILRHAVSQHAQPTTKLGSRIATRFTGMCLNEELPELHQQILAPTDFGE